MPADVLRRPLKAAAKKLGGVRTRCAQEEGVLLTFDDGPHAEVTPAILDRLKDYDVKAVFFILGRNIELAPDLLQRILDEGHVIGNHSYRHELAGGVHVIDYYRDLMRCQDAVFACTRYRPALFRPPTGALSIASIGAAMLAGLAPVLWSVDARDWALRSVDGAAQAGRRLAAELGRGDILLLHDDHPFLTPLLDELLPRLREAGLNRTVSGLPRLN
ncbi:MAG TPA: polysaccharide deacetylase family protein [Woeseiaceae bacterium]|nr:polysaccharide deacetylase family protein [Woeseiaceae bacterium]